MAGCISRQNGNSSARTRAAYLRAWVLGAVLLPVCHAGSADSQAASVTAVRFWSLGDLTRIAVEIDADFTYKTGRLSDPDRAYFDIAGARPQMASKGIHSIAVGDGVVKQIRVAETQPGVTRIVLDLEDQVELSASQLARPARLMIELRAKAKPWPAPVPAETKIEEPAPAPPPRVLSKPAPRQFVPPAIETPSTPPPALKIEQRPEVRVTLLPPYMAPAKLAKIRGSSLPNLPPPPPETRLAVSKPEIAKPETETRPATGGTEKRAGLALPPVPARKNSTGGQSLTRVLGLKLGRVVLDPGHGGHDEGTRGPSGLTEKELVLDVAHRLGALLEQRLGSDVVYTRTNDVFVPLEERTRIANEHRADLFLSIHANSSPIRTVSGVETYYLNFTTSKTALELASRENASAEHSIFDLKELLAKIALKDKVDESREFATRLQNSLYTISAADNKGTRNRGIKRAPFVVLIGADMPSVLSEIGFLTNAADETLLRKDEHRDKIAEALYKGISSYADTLSRSVVVRSK
jgi:N-acetylmuramoyl-L-alanine amidase